MHEPNITKLNVYFATLIIIIIVTLPTPLKLLRRSHATSWFHT